MNKNISMAWMSAGTTTPWRCPWQPQWLCAQSSPTLARRGALRNAATIQSARKPTTIAAATFTATIFSMSDDGTRDEMSTGRSSSEVERKTARSVPVVMTPPAKNDAAAADTPHCGIAPASPPATGPNERERPRNLPSAPPACASTASRTR